MVNPDERAEQYSYFLIYPTADSVDLAKVAANAGISLESAKAMKGKLMTTTTIFDNLVVHGYDPKKIPGWVARPASGKPVAGSPQSESPAPVTTAGQSVASVEKSVQSVEKVEAGTQVPIGEGEKAGETLPLAQPVRLMPQPGYQPQPRPAEPTINQPNRSPSTRELPQPTREQPTERPNIIYIEGKPAVQLKDSGGKMRFRWATPEDLEPPPQEGTQVGASISKATLQEVELRTQAIMSKVAFSPSNVMVHAFLSGTKDQDTGRPYFEGDFADFINWAINYAVLDAYGIRVGMITSGKGKYQQMKRAAQIGQAGSGIDPNVGGITPIV